LSRWFREPVPPAIEHHAPALLRQMVPTFDFDDLDAEPCCTTHTVTGFPFIDFADDPRIVWLVGCNAHAGNRPTNWAVWPRGSSSTGPGPIRWMRKCSRRGTREAVNASFALQLQDGQIIEGRVTIRNPFQ
jgi:hypothetical protein